MQVTPYIFDTKESIFNYEYLRKFEANIAKAFTIVQGTCTKLIYLKKSKNPSHCHVSTGRTSENVLKYLQIGHNI
jgi:hypothetical protein